jgi:capsule polysaccharide export protein KpsE/RkpR
MPMGVTNEILVENEEEDRGTRSRADKLRNWLDVGEYLWSRRVSVFWWALVGTALSGLLAYRICFYEATAQVMPPDTGSNSLSSLALPGLLRAPGTSNLAGLATEMFGMKTSGALFVKVLESRTVEDNLVNQFDLRTRYSWHGKMYYEDARSKLESRTKISEDKKSGVISITVKDRNPDLAKAMADEYVKQLDRLVVQVATSAARREREFLEQRLQEEKKILADSEQRFSKFASSSMALDVPEQTRVMLEASAKLQGELIVARSELKGLEQTYTPENPRVRTVRARIDELERELKRINGQSVTGDPGSPASPYPSVKQLPTVGLEWAELYRDRKTHEAVYEMLTQQYEMARVQEAREIPTVKVLDPADRPEKIHPRPILVVGIGALVSVILACLGLHLQHSGRGWGVDDPRRIVLTRLFIRGKAS